jgi:hypothetical protein
MPLSEQIVKAHWFFRGFRLLFLTLSVSGLSLALRLTPSPTNPPRPQIGFADGCNEVITISPSGIVSIVTTNQPTYDGADDQLVGRENSAR